MGVTRVHSTEGAIIVPPALRLYAVLPDGVEITSPSDWNVDTGCSSITHSNLQRVRGYPTTNDHIIENAV